MNREVPELSLYELLFVPEGPPETVWERALDAAFAAVEQDSGDGGEFEAADPENAMEDTDAEPDSDDEHDDDWPSGSGVPEPGNLPEVPGWDPEGKLLADGDGDGVGG